MFVQYPFNPDLPSILYFREFRLAKDASYWERRAFNKVISKDDLRHARLLTWDHEIKVKIPEKCDHWAVYGTDILFDVDPLAEQIKQRSLHSPELNIKNKRRHRKCTEPQAAD